MEEQQSSQEKNNICSNCELPLIDQANYCHKCGQKNNIGRLTLKALFSQFFDNVFNLDSKIIRTLGALFIPGKLTNAFLKKQHQKYYHPIRLFLVLIVITLAGFKFQDDIPMPTSLRKGRIETLKERKRLMNVFDKGISSIAENSSDKVTQVTLDSLSKVFYKNSGGRVDSIDINQAVRIAVDYEPFRVALEDFGKYSGKEIIDVYEVKGFVNRLKMQQKYKMIQEGTNFIPFVMGKVTWSIFIVLLLLSLIFKILYFKSDFLYLEHLIFGIHLNAFFLIFVSLFTLLSENIISTILPWTLALMAIYLFFALKHVYKQSLLLTIFKFALILISIFFSFIFGVLLTVLGSFILF